MVNYYKLGYRCVSYQRFHILPRRNNTMSYTVLRCPTIERILWNDVFNKTPRTSVRFGCNFGCTILVFRWKWSIYSWNCTYWRMLGKMYNAILVYIILQLCLLQPNYVCNNNYSSTHINNYHSYYYNDDR